jgi:phospholipid/cholesterol/gamma-HCH transport system substrate-binding protein
MSARILDRRVLAAVGALVVLGLVATLLVRPWASAEPFRLSAVFKDTTGLYEGNDVRVLGVKVGTVTAVRPHGETVRVDMELPAGTEIPRGADAAIMQSSLVTDRYVELTPAYRRGPLLPSGTLLPLSRTRNPANLDEMVRAVDQLVVALGAPGKGRSDVGRLLSVSARSLDGQGRFVRDALVAAQGAMDAVSGTEPDLAALTENLDSLVTALGHRDKVVRRLSGNVTDATAMLARQRGDLRAVVTELASLVQMVTRFVRDNRAELRSVLGHSDKVLTTLEQRQADMKETLDLLPLVGQNMWRAYDPRTKRLRIRIDMRNTGPLSSTARYQLCQAFGLTQCEKLTNPDGTGALDPLLNELTDKFPSGVPGVTE